MARWCRLTKQEIKFRSQIFRSEWRHKRPAVYVCDNLWNIIFHAINLLLFIWCSAAGFRQTKKKLFMSKTNSDYLETEAAPRRRPPDALMSVVCITKWISTIIFNLHHHCSFVAVKRRLGSSSAERKLSKKCEYRNNIDRPRGAQTAPSKQVFLSLGQATVAAHACTRTWPVKVVDADSITTLPFLVAFAYAFLPSSQESKVVKEIDASESVAGTFKCSVSTSRAKREKDLAEPLNWSSRSRWTSSRRTDGGLCGWSHPIDNGRRLVKPVARWSTIDGTVKIAGWKQRMSNKANSSVQWHWSHVAKSSRRGRFRSVHRVCDLLTKSIRYNPVPGYRSDLFVSTVWDKSLTIRELLLW